LTCNFMTLLRYSSDKKKQTAPRKYGKKTSLQVIEAEISEETYIISRVS